MCRPLSHAAPVQCVLPWWDGLQHGFESRHTRRGPGISCPQGHGCHDPRWGDTQRESEENGRMVFISMSINHYTEVFFPAVKVSLAVFTLHVYSSSFKWPNSSFFPLMWHRSDLYYEHVSSKEAREIWYCQIRFRPHPRVEMNPVWIWDMSFWLWSKRADRIFPVNASPASLKMWQFCILMRETHVQRTFCAVDVNNSQNSKGAMEDEGLKNR